MEMPILLFAHACSVCALWLTFATRHILHPCQMHLSRTTSMGRLHLVYCVLCIMSKMHCEVGANCVVSRCLPSCTTVDASDLDSAHKQLWGPGARPCITCMPRVLSSLSVLSSAILDTQQIASAGWEGSGDISDMLASSLKLSNPNTAGASSTRGPFPKAPVNQEPSDSEVKHRCSMPRLTIIPNMYAQNCSLHTEDYALLSRCNTVLAATKLVTEWVSLTITKHNSCVLALLYRVVQITQQVHSLQLLLGQKLPDGGAKIHSKIAQLQRELTQLQTKGTPTCVHV